MFKKKPPVVFGTCRRTVRCKFTRFSVFIFNGCARNTWLMGRESRNNKNTRCKNRSKLIKKKVPCQQNMSKRTKKYGNLVTFFFIWRKVSFGVTRFPLATFFYCSCGCFVNCACCMDFVWIFGTKKKQKIWKKKLKTTIRNGGAFTCAP